MDLAKKVPETFSFLPMMVQPGWGLAVTDSLWIDFVNSDWHDYLGRGRDRDRLEQAAWVHGFLSRWDLEPISTEGEATRSALRELRTLLLRLVETLVARRRPDPADLRTLNAYLSRGPVISRVTGSGNGYRLDLAPMSRGLDAVLYRIAASFARFLIGDETGRLKICANRDCGRIYLDRTRNRRRRWCDDGCGNLMKVRRFRKRERKGAAAGPTARAT